MGPGAPRAAAAHPTLAPPASRPSVRPSVRAGGRRRGSDARDAAPPAVAVMSPPPAGEGARAEPPFLLWSRGWGRGDSAGGEGSPRGGAFGGSSGARSGGCAPKGPPTPAVVSAGEGLGVSLASGGFWGLPGPARPLLPPGWRPSRLCLAGDPSSLQ